MRPASIIWFERLYAIAIALGVIEAIVVIAAINGGTATTGVHLAGGAVVVLIGTAIPLLLLWLVSWRASDVARWILVLLTGLSVVLLIAGMVRGGYIFNIAGWLGLVHRAVTVAAVAMTFRPDAQAWLVKQRPEA